MFETRNDIDTWGICIEFECIVHALYLRRALAQIGIKLFSRD